MNDNGHKECDSTSDIYHEDREFCSSTMSHKIVKDLKFYAILSSYVYIFINGMWNVYYDLYYDVTSKNSSLIWKDMFLFLKGSY